jgi:predicted transcriptional regulator
MNQSVINLLLTEEIMKTVQNYKQVGLGRVYYTYKETKWNEVGKEARGQMMKALGALQGIA